MTWENFPWGPALTVAVLLATVLLLALDERNRRKFMARDEAKSCEKKIRADVDGVGRKVERNTALFVALDDRVGDLEEKVSVVEERQTQQWERISEQMSNTATTIRDVTKELKEISRMQQEHAIRLERIARGDQ